MMNGTQRRAVVPESTGFAERDGVRLAYEVFDGPRDGAETALVDGDEGARRQSIRDCDEGARRQSIQQELPTVVLLPTWQIIASQFWKLQVGTLRRHGRVLTYDGRGTGGSSRPVGAAAYADAECAEDIIAVLDATGTERAVLVALSCANPWAVRAAAKYPERVAGIVAISPTCGFPIPDLRRDGHRFDVPVDGAQGWAMYNKHFWLNDDFSAFRRFFFEQMCSEPHSTKQIEDFLDWSADTDPSLLADATSGRLGLDGALCTSVENDCRQVRCPVAVVHGTDDRIRPFAIGERLAELTGGSLLAVEGAGHALPAREPVLINRFIGDLVRAVAVAGLQSRALAADRMKPQRATWVRAPGRPRRALYLSSPIGLGHAQRDVAIARELRSLRPDVEIDWLAQHPVTRVLNGHGERIHPASAALLNESTHIESECGEHDLHAFSAIRRMDEILVNNFMVFSELVESEYFDLVIGDEAWDVDHFLHENPELKRFRFGWLTDFVGWLPMPDADDRERFLTADLNAEMIEHRSRFGPVRDRSIFVGNPADVVPDDFGPGLPPISGWVRQNFDFSGYVTGFDPTGLRDPAELRQRWGCAPDERLCIVTVGGSGVGGDLLRRVLDAVPLIRRRVPDLHVLVVTGPRLDPAALPPMHGVSTVGYLPDLYRELASCDVAVVQGGLTTCMELTAAGTPFVYVPLRHHFEQNFHVRHRLEQYNAGRYLDYADASVPDLLADAVIAELSSTPKYRPVETDGAQRAAAMLAELL